MKVPQLLYVPRFQSSRLKISGDISLSSLFSTQSLLRVWKTFPNSWKIVFTKIDPEMVFR